jgi:PAS domain S-box-containing protein
MNLLTSKLATKFLFFLLLSTLFSLFSALGIFVTYYVSTGTYPSLLLFIGVSIAASIFGSFLVGFIFTKIALSPVKKMMEAVRFLTAGNLNINLQVKSRDEFEEMANQLNFLAKKMQENNQKLEADKYLLWAEKNKAAVTLGSVADGVIGLDSNQKVILFNKAAETITGIPVTSALNKDIQTLFKLFDETTKEIAPSIYCPIRNDDYEGVVWQNNRTTLKTTTNKEIPVDIITSKIKESVRANLGCIITIHDLTKEKQLEEMKLDFVSMAAHELRTPITSISGYLSVFMDEMKGKIPQSEVELLDKIEFASKQLLALVDNMLNVSKIERGVFSVTVAPMDFVDLVDKIVSELIERAKSKGQTLEWQKPTAPFPPVEGDIIRLGEVLTNLISNAIKYTQPNGHVKVELEQKDNEIITHIKDNGRGIPPESIPNLFQKFYRVVSKLEQSSKGNGLGLYISKAIVEVHHGKIWVESEVGKGTTFSFSIPSQQFQYQTFSQGALGLNKPSLMPSPPSVSTTSPAPGTPNPTTPVTTEVSIAMQPQ